jgi:hypothetical protein
VKSKILVLVGSTHPRAKSFVENGARSQFYKTIDFAAVVGERGKGTRLSPFPLHSSPHLYEIFE